MRGKTITSRDNPLVKRARSVRDGKIHDLIFIEGVRLAEEAARSALSIQDILYTEKLVHERRGARLLRTLSDQCEKTTLVSEQVLASISDTKTPQGIVVLASRPAGVGGWGSGFGKEREESSHRNQLPQHLTPNPYSPLIVIMHRVNNPSNAGAILRTAEAAGASGVVVTAGSTDIFSPKALRGAMGSSFRLPVWEGARFSDVLAWCAVQGVRTVSTTASSARAYTEIDWTGASALIVGEEGAGLGHEEIAAADEAVRIPMRTPVESLNVAVATAIVLYEAARQRGFLETRRD